MVHLSALAASVLAFTALGASASSSSSFKGWKTYKANGANLGAWLELEQTYAGGVIPDAYVGEWTYCEAVGYAVCGPVLEHHYSTYVTTADIDKLARYGVNTVRISTTYAVWYDFADSWLYHGNQLAALRTISEYAITRYNMHVIIGFHSLPGGVNDLEGGEASGHNNWWYNSTHFAESMIVVGKALDYISSSPNSASYTFSPMNEPGDNPEYLFTTEMVSYPSGVNYVLKYYKAVYAMMQARGMSTTLMVSDTYAGPAYWAPYWAVGSNIVFDTHIYYFAAEGVSGYQIPELVCAKAKNSTTTFPTSLYAFQKYLSGGSYWNVKYLDTDDIASGTGSMAQYWGFETLIDEGVINAGGALTQVMKGC
ncbi:hypothetical protein RQP46_009975 [Phenoliferia psychrophenolica]